MNYWLENARPNVVYFPNSRVYIQFNSMYILMFVKLVAKYSYFVTLEVKYTIIICALK